MTGNDVIFILSVLFFLTSAFSVITILLTVQFRGGIRAARKSGDSLILFGFAFAKTAEVVAWMIFNLLPLSPPNAILFYGITPRMYCLIVILLMEISCNLIFSLFVGRNVFAAFLKKRLTSIWKPQV